MTIAASRVGRFLLLPVAYYVAVPLCMIAALGLSGWGAKLGEHSLGLRDEPGSARKACKLARSLPHKFISTQRPCACGGDAEPCRCKRQVDSRDASIQSSRERLNVACYRYVAFETALSRHKPWARAALREEEAEIRGNYRGLRQLVGPSVEEESNGNRDRLAVTFLLGFLALCGFGAHARSVGIPRSLNRAALLRPWLAISAVTLVGAIIVIAWESLEVGKTSFDWSSYCVSGSAFWVYHLQILPLSLATAVQLAAGWYVTNAKYVPTLDPGKPRWGVGAYVTFLEAWCFLIVVLVAAISAYWLHELAKDAASRTNVVVSFAGIGALLVVGVLIARFVRNALSLRTAYEALAFQRKDVPDDPTEGLLGKSFWQLPGVFVAAWGLAYALLEWVGAGRLAGGAP